MGDIIFYLGFVSVICIREKVFEKWKRKKRKRKM